VRDARTIDAMPIRRLETTDTDETLALGRALAEALREEGCRGLLVELQGDLGAGKTVFVRGVARGIGVPAEARVVSPTFTIARAYPIAGDVLHTLHHLDAYRLRGIEDLDAIGFEEMCGDGCLTCVEWGEYVAEALPVDRIRVTFQALPPEDLQPGEAPECPRSVDVEALGPEARRVVSAWMRLWEARGGRP
jgi:tRNA threonylcarbamoyladenosine biosynthesis protein TsaE